MGYFHHILKHSRTTGHSELLHLHSSISANPSQIGTFLTNESARADFLEKFPTYVENLLHFLSFNSKQRSEPGRITGAHNIAREVLILVVEILSHSEFKLADTDVVVKLVVAALKRGLSCQPPPTSLRVIAKKLPEEPGFLERIVSSEDGAGVIGDLFSVHFINSVPAIANSWAKKLFELCSVCAGTPICHNIVASVEKWRKLSEVSTALESLQREIDTAPPPQYSRYHITGVMRRLSEDDKKSFQTRNSASSCIPQLPDHIITLLDELQLQPPRSSRAVETLSAQIRSDQMTALVITVLSTFPCRPCNELSRDPQALRDRGKLQAPRNRKDSGCFVADVPKQDTLFGGKIGLWKMLLSAEAFKDIQRQVLGGSIDILESRLRRLASGDWRRGKLSTPVGTAAQRKYLPSPLLKAEVGKQLHILWQVDFGPCEDGVYRQHIKIWRVVDPKDVPGAIEHVIRVWRSKILRLDCGEVWSELPRLDQASGVYVPVESYSQHNNSRHEIFNDPSSPTISAEDGRALEACNKFYEFTKPVMDSFLTKNLTAEFPFDTSPEEIEVIKHNESGTLIMGRSGTGKTTCLVQKLVRNYTARKSLAGQAVIRQVLLTRSRLLVEKLKVYTRRLVESQLSKALPTEEQSDDFTLGEENLMISKTLISLEDGDFPLVCTFDQLLRLLEQSVEFSNRQKFRGAKKVAPMVVGKSGQYVRRSQVVDFTLFKSEYWRQFPNSLSRDYEPSLVFAEILGIIKGSISSAGELGSLTREQYLALSHKRAPTFSSLERQDVYDLYLRYESQKSRNGDSDGIDRVISLLKFLRTADTDSKNTIEGILEEIYVDEVQDQRSADIILLLKLVKNPCGIHFAGDSAQCISKDSTFRFNDLKAMFFNQFTPLAEASNNQSLARAHLFELNTNFRSHQGIISLASFVMELLYKGFPQSVDKMEKERGQYEGTIPTLFVGFGAEVLAQRLVGLTDVFGSVADFGAEQVILVRDDVMKEKVQHEIGDAALVLSILDSKGMEFDDVFLLDFFSSTPTPSGIRCLKDILIPGSQKSEIERNALLCSELKHLYVAITRPRIQLWILESAPEAAEPIVKLLTENENRFDPLVEVVKRSDPDIGQKLKRLKPAVSSDPKKYSEMGYKLLQRGLYSEANFCFRKAADVRGQTISRAHMNMEEGRGHRGDGSTGKFLELFREAVRLFREASQLGNAAFCLEEMNHLEEAGDVWVEIGRREKAAELYMQSHSWLKAFECYDMIESHAEAAAALRQGEQFDHLVQYLAENRDRFEHSQLAAYSKLCTILLTQGRISPDLQEFVIDSLGSDTEKEEFLRKFHLGKHLVKVLVKNRNYGEAFRELVSDGRIADALELGLEHVNDDLRVPSQELIRLLHYMEFKRLLGSLLGTLEDGKHPQISSQSLVFPADISCALGNWASLSSTIQESNLRDVFSGLQSGLHRDILSVAIAVHWPDLAALLEGMRVLVDLRPIVQVLNRVVSILGSTQDEDQELPLAVSIVMGAFPIHNTPETWLLDYSPVCDGKKARYTSGEVAMRCKSKLIEQMIALYIRLDDVGRLLWLPRGGDICPRMKNITNGGAVIARIVLEGIKHRLGLEVMSLLVCSFQVVHNGPARNIEPFSRKYWPTKRFWLESHLSEVIFRSAIQHDCETSTNAISKITTMGSEYVAILQGFEGLLFHRLRRDREWHLRNDLSSIFEQLQLSESLGQRVADRFRIYTKLNMKKGNFTPSPHQHHLIKHMEHEQQVYQVVQHIQDAIFHAKRNEYHGFMFSLKPGLAKLLRLPGNNFTCFHSIIGMFERLGSFLFLWTSPAACILPLSWIKLHLSVLINNPAQITGKEQERFAYRESLVLLLESFIEVVRYLNDDSEFYYSYGTRTYKAVPGMPKRPSEKAEAFGQGIQERNRNFLVIALINLAAMPVPSRGAAKVFTEAQNLFGHPNLCSREYHGRSPTAWVELLHQSFAHYEGKDSLTIVTAKGTVPNTLPNVFLPLASRNVLTHTLTALIKPIPHGTASQPAQAAESNDNDTADGTTVTSAVTKLQAFWRTRWPYLRSHRASLSNPQGKARAFVFEKIIKPNLRRAAPGNLCKTIVLDTVGVDFYVAFWKLRSDATAANSLSQSVLTSKKMSAADVEELVDGELMGDLDAIVRDAARARLGAKEVGKKFADPLCLWGELKKEFTRERRKIKSTEDKLAGIVKRLERMLAGL
ncbi:hypothetical protein BDD12DRAFT_898763 [Trichophaea hybrida]|nr:hypothetical protein BDD12DRAFT_898763 [Trichophaea hybrida]